MERTTWGQINELFEAARRMPASEREAWVRAAAADERVQSEVLSLLRAHEDDPWFVDEPAGSSTPPRVTPAETWPASPAPVTPGRTPSHPATGRQASTPSDPTRRRRAPEPQAGGQFATYRLIREMSRDPARIVFEAVATSGGARPRVALHVLTADARNPAFAELLHVHSDILAHLDHPGIPRLLDGGVSGNGTAYLAFEYAAGDPIDAWCRERGLTLRDRVGRVLAVCDAVQHVHEHLIIDGDLRPAKILVSADAEVRLLDCGMSPLLGFGSSPGGTAALLHPCMSPEQARGEVPLAASDVYGLGVLLYTLATGYAPYELSGLTPARALDTICEIEPDVPSAIAGGRDGRELAGTLDRIILKALRKNPRERYATAAALAADLRAWRDGVQASVSPAARWPRTIAAGGRAVRTGALAIAVIAPLAGAGVLGWQAYLLRGERDQARSALAETYRRLAEIQARTAGADPANLATAAASLDAAAAAGEQALAADPRLASAAVTLTGTYGDLVGVRLAQADAVAAGKAEVRLRALIGQLTRDLPGDAQASAAAASGYVRLGAFREAGGDAAAAKVMYGNAVAAFETLTAEGGLAESGQADYARAQRRLGALALQEGDVDDAERLLLAAQAFDADARRPLDAAARREIADTAGGLALVARQRGDAAKAEALWTRALAALQAASGGAPADQATLAGLADVHASLGSLCRSQRRFEEALAHYRNALRARERELVTASAPPSAKLSLAVAQISVARLLLDLAEIRQSGSNDAVRLREAGALLAQAGPAVRAAAPVLPAQQDARAELDRQSERLRRLTSRRR
ncbi:MAG: serine/threonine-protein kinase [Vicinamibacterales bacterium]|jgi:tetratricopeptide (TPR) repeat protein|nr:serine/threonine-protein kinase [Vicinamibacterales bacterium]